MSNGVWLAKEIKKKSDVPIVLMSAYPEAVLEGTNDKKLFYHILEKSEECNNDLSTLCRLIDITRPEI